MAGPIRRRKIVASFLPLALAAAALSACTQANTVSGLAPATAPAAALPAPIAAQQLVGSTPAVLNAELGQPALRRVDGSAQVWLYQSATCGLNLFLFPDSAGTPRVASAVPDSANPVGCMASLQRTALAARPLESPLERPAAS